MFVSESYVTSLILGITTMLCWGSNMNACKNLPYSVAYYNLDFVIWCFIWIVILCAILGLDYFPPNHEQSVITNFLEVSTWILQILGPFLAGVTNVGTQIVQFSTIDAVGLSSGIPLLFGIAMVIGAILTYLVSQSGKFIFILSGVLVDFLGVILNTIAYSKMKPQTTPTKSPTSTPKSKTIKNDEDKKESGLPSSKPELTSNSSETKKDPNAPNDKDNLPSNKDTLGTNAQVESTLTKSEIQDNMAASSSISAVPTTVPVEPAEPVVEDKVTVTIETNPPKKTISTTKLVILCIIGAICNSSWGPLSAFADQGEIGLSAYGSMFLVCLGQLIFVFPLNLILMKCPLSGKKSNWKNWFKAPFRFRWPAIWSSFLFSFGCICYASSGSYLGYATSYALSRGIMLVAALWGILYYKEFKNASAVSWVYEIFTLLCYIVGTILIACSSE